MSLYNTHGLGKYKSCFSEKRIGKQKEKGKDDKARTNVVADDEIILAFGGCGIGLLGSFAILLFSSGLNGLGFLTSRS